MPIPWLSSQSSSSASGRQWLRALEFPHTPRVTNIDLKRLGAIHAMPTKLGFTSTNTDCGTTFPGRDDLHQDGRGSNMRRHAIR